MHPTKRIAVAGKGPSAASKDDNEAAPHSRASAGSWELLFSASVNEAVEHCRTALGEFARVTPVLQPCMHRYAKLLERLAYLGHARSLLEPSGDTRAVRLAAALFLILGANGLHAKPGLADDTTAEPLHQVAIPTSVKVLLGDYFMSSAFKLLVQLEDLHILGRFSDAALTMAETDVLALGLHELTPGRAGMHLTTILDRGLAVLAGAALESAIRLGARLGLTPAEGETLGRRIGVLYLLSVGHPSCKGDVTGLSNDHPELAVARSNCLEVWTAVHRLDSPDSTRSKEFMLLQQLVQELVGMEVLPCSIAATRLQVDEVPI